MTKQSKEDKYSDFITVEKNKKEIIPEDYPEGPYGSPIEGSLQKSSRWKKGQQAISAYTYENKNLHESIPRQHSGAHPTHDDNKKDRSNPY